MTRRLPLLAVLLALPACKADVAFNQVAATLAVWPDLVDLGNVPVGSEAEANVQLDHQSGGTVEVVSVAFEGEASELFDVTTLPETLGPGDEIPFTITYTPDAEGYHLATLVIETTATTERLEVSTRGRSGRSTLSLWPSLLDLGPVPAGGVAEGEITLSNSGSVELSVESATVGAPFTVLTTLPLPVPAGGAAKLAVEVRPSDTDPVVDMLVLDGVGVDAEVTVRVNDCLNGDPILYDVDGDGITACAGDCDDGRADVKPGGVEVCDSADNDCDNTTDETTSCYDDDGDGVTEDEGDCNDGDAAVSPRLSEIPQNDVDDDCDGEVDVAGVDADGDGYGPGAGDCADTDATAYPGAPEIVDGNDEDCDGVPDNGTNAYDDDGDGYSEDQGDCNDDDRFVFPTAPETADGEDDDCDGKVDEGTERYDDDGDGYSEIGGDCNDANPAIYPPC